MARGLELLSLQARLYYVEGVGDETGQASSDARTNEIPADRVGLGPGLEVGLQVLVHTDHSHREGDVHAHCHGVRSVESPETLVLYDVFNALNSCQVGTQLEPLFYH